MSLVESSLTLAFEQMMAWAVPELFSFDFSFLTLLFVV